MTPILSFSASKIVNAVCYTCGGYATFEVILMGIRFFVG